jgi:hypothetical protein
MGRNLLYLLLLFLWLWGFRYFIEHPLLKSFLERSNTPHPAETNSWSTSQWDPSVSPAVTVLPLALPDPDHGRPAGVHCITPPARVIAPSSSHVYRWINETGHTQYADRAPAGVNAERVILGQPPAPQYFVLNINYLGRDPIPFLRGQVQAGTTRIFQIISGLMGPEYLRQIELNIRLYEDRTAYQHYAQSVSGPVSANAGGFYTTLTHEAVTYRHAEDSTTLAVLRHESVHVIAAGIIGTGIPVWLNEGLAEYFELLHVAGQYGEVSLSQSSHKLARDTLSRGYPARLTDFLQLGQTNFYDNRMMTAHYALASSLIFFLLDSRHGSDALASLMRAQADDPCTTIEHAGWLEHSYPGGVAALERDFRAWLQNTPARTLHRY